MRCLCSLFLKYRKLHRIFLENYKTSILTIFVPLTIIEIFCTERGGSVVTHETRVREVPGSNPGGFRGFPQSSRQMLGWIFITTIHLTIIHQIHYHKIKISELNK